MRTTLKTTCLAGTLAMIAAHAMAADVRDVSAMLGAMGSLQESGATTDALGFETARALGLDEASDLQVRTINELPNDLGRVVRFQQTVNGIPVKDQHVIVEQDSSGTAIMLEGTAVFDIAPEESSAATPSLSAAEALEKAKEAVVRLTPAPPFRRRKAAGNLRPLKMNSQTWFTSSMARTSSGCPI